MLFGPGTYTRSSLEPCLAAPTGPLVHAIQLSACVVSMDWTVRVQARDSR